MNGLTKIPPMIAVKTPAKGGNPDATEMPKHSGSAIRKTRKPDLMSASSDGCVDWGAATAGDVVIFCS
jgi:hypothetical protein